MAPSGGSDVLPGLRERIVQELPGADPDLLVKHRFDLDAFLAFRDAVRRGERTPASSVCPGLIEPPRPGDLEGLPPEGTDEHAELVRRGEAALARGEVAVLVLAGGMATRFAQPSAPGAPPTQVVKGTVEVIDGRSFLGLKLEGVRAVGARVGRSVPFCVMGSFATLEGLSEHLVQRGLLGRDVLLFDQSITLRLTPEGELLGEGRLPREAYATPGHGDVFEALRDTGVTAKLKARGVRTLFLSNIDNLGATLDPALVGLFDRLREERGTAMLAETVQRAPDDGDKVGVLARVDGRLRLLEGLRLPDDADTDALVEASINSFYFDLAALDRDVPLEVHAVAKEVGGRVVWQPESITCEATGTLGRDGRPLLPLAAVRVRRDGPVGRFHEGRFAPVKRPEDLVQLRDRLRASDDRGRARDQRARLRAAFREAYGVDPGAARWLWSPGCVDLMGEHTDHAEGFALPVTVDRGLLVLVDPGTPGRLEAVSLQEDERLDLPLHPSDADAQDGWGRYAAGVITALLEHGVPLAGARLVLTGDLPAGGGMASSSASCVALASALAGPGLDRAELARVAQRAEHLVGVRRGLVGPWAITHGRAGHALLLDGRTLATEPVPLDLGRHVLLVADTAKPRGLVDPTDPQRRAECEEAARQLATLTGRTIGALRDVTPDDLQRHGAALPDVLLRRARHVVTEDDRVLASARLLRDGPSGVPAFGVLLDASHASLRDDFEVSCSELDTMVDALKSTDGGAVLGARTMGGGCVLALVDAGEVERVIEQTAVAYRAATGLRPAFRVVRPSDGLTDLPG